MSEEEEWRRKKSILWGGANNRCLEKARMNYDWGEECDLLEELLFNSFRYAFQELSISHLHKKLLRQLPEKEKTFFYDLWNLCKANIFLYLGEKMSHQDLATACVHNYSRLFITSGSDFFIGDDAFSYEKGIYSFSPKGFEKIVKKQKLNPEQIKEKKELVLKRAYFLGDCKSEIAKAVKRFRDEGKRDKSFWMKNNLREFNKFIKRELGRRCQWQKGYLENLKKNALQKVAEEKKEEMAKAIDKAFANVKWKTVFKNFRKDLEEIGETVDENWEASKHFWEKKDVQISLIIIAGLSAVSSIIAICGWLIRFEWVKSLLE